MRQKFNRKPNKRLINARIERGWSVEEVAEKAGISVRHLRRMENGVSSSPAVKKKLCDVFELDLNSLGLLRVDKRRSAMKRAEFIRKKQENASFTDKTLESGVESSSTIMGIPKHLRRSRRG